MIKIDKKYSKLFKKNKPLFVITTILSCFIVLIFSLWISSKCIVHPNKTYDNTTSSTSITKGNVVYEEGDETNLPTLYKVDENGNVCDDFKVCVIGDLHLVNDRSWIVLKALENFIKIDKPDLVIINGDICFEAHDTYWHKQLNQMFENNNQYWTFTLGNHDGQQWIEELGKDAARQKTFNELRCIDDAHPTGSAHCIARTRTNDISKYGVGNNCIKIKGASDKTLKYLFTFDCEKLNYKNDDLVNWFISTVNTLANDANNYVITHIPFLQMEYACNHLNDSKVSYICGVFNEPICASGAESGLFNAIKSTGKTDCCLFSHDHVNNIAVSYQGIRMQYTLGLAWTCYSSRNSGRTVWNNIAYMLDDSLCNFMDGGTNVYIKNENLVDKSVIGDEYIQFNGALNGMEFDLWKWFYGLITYGHWLTVLNRVIYPIATAGCITYFAFFTIYKLQNKKNKK